MAGRLTARAETPAVATALQVSVALILLWTGTQESIIVYAGVGLSIFSMLAMSSILRLALATPRPPAAVPHARIPCHAGHLSFPDRASDRRHVSRSPEGLRLCSPEHFGWNSLLLRLESHEPQARGRQKPVA